MLCGVLFVANVQVHGDTSSRAPNDLAALLLSESERVAQRQETVAELRQEVAELVTASESNTLSYDRAAAEELAIAAGAVEMSGAGVIVTLTDAPADTPLTANMRPDDLVVHQQDLQAVVNALWAGGAEAITIQGQRVISTTAVQCVGNTLLLHGRLYSPPYRIAAIGPQDEMMHAVLDDPAVQVYLQYVDAVGLGWSLERTDEIVAGPYQSAITRAKLPANFDIFDTLPERSPAPAQVTYREEPR